MDERCFSHSVMDSSVVGSSKFQVPEGRDSGSARQDACLVSGMHGEGVRNICEEHL
jgi:hypothetical protein